MENEKLIDFEALAVFTGNDKDLMKLHISTFLEFAPSQLERLQKSLESKDWLELKNTAHKLKPKLAYMGMQSLVPSVQSIEDKASEEKDLDQMDALVSSVVNNCKAAFDELQAFL